VSAYVCTICHRSVDPDDARYHVRGCPATRTAYVRVLAPCACAACAANRAWFWCENDGGRVTAEYLVEGLVDAPDQATPSALASVAAKHPGCTLLNLDLPADCRAHLVSGIPTPR